MSFERRSHGFFEPNFDYFLSDPADMAERQEFIDRGLIPTNNLKLKVMCSHGEAAEDTDHMFDYHGRPYEQAFEECRETNKELWHEAIEVAAEHNLVLANLWDRRRAGEAYDDVAELRAHARELYWREAELYTELFRDLAPRLQREGIEPLSVCI